jgi:hypothetical protein
VIADRRGGLPTDHVDAHQDGGEQQDDDDADDHPHRDGHVGLLPVVSAQVKRTVPVDVVPNVRVELRAEGDREKAALESPPDVLAMPRARDAIDHWYQRLPSVASERPPSFQYQLMSEA